MSINDAKDLVYLRRDTMIEPLFDRWYAWSYLIPPATAARNITHRHLPIMESYISTPHVHAAAVKNPKMLGGPFIDYEGKRVGDVSALRDATRENAAPLLELSESIEQLDELIRREAKGRSLAPLYPAIPEPLRGYVELVYDLNNHAAFRPLESLLYKSKYYMPELQTILLSTTASDGRPFTLSTPRLDTEGTLSLQMPFADSRVDLLAKLKWNPMSEAEVVGRLGLTEDETVRFRRFLTTSAPEPCGHYEGNSARWRYFGHACILLETATRSILFDPVISYSYANELHRYTYDDLPETIDYIVITHNHQDHVLLETLLHLRHKTKHVVVPRASGMLQDPSMRLLLKAVGFDNVIELDELETIEFDGGSITGLPFIGEHADLDIRSKLAYLVRVGSQSLLFAADSCNIEPKIYEHVHKVVGDVDVLFLGMECDGAPLSWLYGPLLTQKVDRQSDQSRRLSGSNYAQGMAIVNQFSFKEVYVYAMGQEPWLNYIMSIKYTDESNPIIQSNRLLDECRSRGLTAERLYGEREILLSSGVFA